MIYTSFEMIRDCREDRPEGWRYLVANYVPAIRKLLAHYQPMQPAPVKSVLMELKNPQSGFFRSIAPAPERQFVAELRQAIVAGLQFPPPEIALDLETAATALAPLTLAEKQAAWTEGMGYTAEEAGAMLRMAPATISKIRARAAELLRGAVDIWRRSLLEENGPGLGLSAARAVGAECLPAKAFLDALDGRTTWRGREEMERHAAGCLHCVDHFCRMAEVVALLRDVEPLADEEAGPYYALLGVKGGGKRWRTSRAQV